MKQGRNKGRRICKIVDMAGMCKSQSGAFNLCLSGMVLSRQAFWDHIEPCCGDTAAAHRSLPLPFWSDFDCGCGAASVSLCSDVCSADVPAV